MNIFSTPRLQLRPTAVTDAAFILELMNTQEWYDNIGDRNVRSMADAEAYIKVNHLPQLERLGYSSFTVVRMEDGECIGSCSLFDRDLTDDIEIGFAFLPAHHGQGYAYESASRLKEVAENEYGITALSAITIESNIASRKLLEKLNLRYVKTFTLRGESEEVMLYRWEK